VPTLGLELGRGTQQPITPCALSSNILKMGYAELYMLRRSHMTLSIQNGKSCSAKLSITNHIRSEQTQLISTDNKFYRVSKLHFNRHITSHLYQQFHLHRVFPNSSMTRPTFVFWSRGGKAMSKEKGAWNLWATGSTARRYKPISCTLQPISTTANQAQITTR